MSSELDRQIATKVEQIRNAVRELGQPNKVEKANEAMLLVDALAGYLGIINTETTLAGVADVVPPEPTE